MLRKIPGDYTRDQRDEMTAAALVGLFEGLKRYDPSKQSAKGKGKFSNYAMNWIRHEVMEWRAKNSRSLPIPRKAWNQYRNIEKRFAEDYGPEADIELATDQQLSEIEIEVMVGKPGSSGTGSHRGEKEPKAKKVQHAGAIRRGMKQTYLLDPDDHDSGTESAEDTFFKEEERDEEVRMVKTATR